jgi:transcriptional regulator with XRE-family HTH domain
VSAKKAAASKGVRAFQGFGRALQALREGAGLSQGEVSRRTGISRAALSRYESGQSWPRLERLDAVLSAMTKDVLDLGLALYREQAEARGGEGRAFDRPDLLASPAGRQILDHSRMLFFTGRFWIDAALALVPAARPSDEDAEKEQRSDGEHPTEEADAGSGTG